MANFMMHVCNLIFRLMPQNGEDFAAERRRNDRKPPRPPKGVTVAKTRLAGMYAERIEKSGNEKGWILYIHGGGFTTGSARERRAICQYIAGQYGYNCLSFDYRLAPENKWPAQPEDSMAAWKALKAKGIREEETVLMGESAGGLLALSLALQIKEKGLKQPRAIVAFSPCTNQAEHYPSHRENAGTDYMLRDKVYKGMQEPVFGKDAAKSILRDPVASPIYGDYTGLPPVFLSASDTEALLDDSRELYKNLKKEGHKAKLEIQHGCFHAWQVFPMIREARISIEKAFRFIGEC